MKKRESSVKNKTSNVFNPEEGEIDNNTVYLYINIILGNVNACVKIII